MRSRARVGTGGKKPKVRPQTPFYCIVDLQNRLEEHVVAKGVGKAMDLGEYMSVPTTHAVRGTALVKCGDLLVALLTVCPAGMIKYKDLKAASQTLGLKFKGLVPECKGGIEEWSTRVSQQMVTLLHHLRRTKDSTDQTTVCVVMLFLLFGHL